MINLKIHKLVNSEALSAKLRDLLKGSLISLGFWRTNPDERVSMETLIAFYHKLNLKIKIDSISDLIDDYLFLKRATSTFNWKKTWVLKLEQMYLKYGLVAQISISESVQPEYEDKFQTKESFSEYALRVSFDLKKELKLETFNGYNNPIISTQDNFYNLNYREGDPPYNFKETFFIDSQNVLNSHLTPYFVIDKVKNLNFVDCLTFNKCFRRENPDKSHLCEFNQLEIHMESKSKDPSMELKQLFLKAYAILGLDLDYIEFRTTHYPYVSPTYQMYYTKDCFIEIGGCGVMLNSIIKDKRLYLAGAIGLERCYAIVYNLKTISQVHPLIHK